MCFPAVHTEQRAPWPRTRRPPARHHPPSPPSPTVQLSGIQPGPSATGREVKNLRLKPATESGMAARAPKAAGAFVLATRRLELSGAGRGGGPPGVYVVVVYQTRSMGSAGRGGPGPGPVGKPETGQSGSRGSLRADRTPLRPWQVLLGAPTPQAGQAAGSSSATSRPRYLLGSVTEPQGAPVPVLGALVQGPGVRGSGERPRQGSFNHVPVTCLLFILTRLENDAFINRTAPLYLYPLTAVWPVLHLPGVMGRGARSHRGWAVCSAEGVRA